MSPPADRRPGGGGANPPLPSSRRVLFLCVALAILTVAVYGGLGRNGFTDYDDPAYITNNPHVQAGLTAETAAWAFRTGYHANWHPLTWLSHALDCQIFGLDPAGHHLVSLALHALNAVLLLLALHLMTGALWRSAFVAALFAVHPLHVESVAWAAERKDVLSTLFWMLALVAYARHAARPGKAARVLLPVLLALGLLAKPMLVTLPFALLLLDYWPLRRWSAGSAGGRLRWIPPSSLVVEKWPLFALAAVSSVVTWAVQRHGGAVADFDSLPFGTRIANAVVGYVTYLVRTFRPVDLGVLYPYAALPAWKVAGACAALAAVTAAVAASARRSPYLVTGWLWYLGTLVPVIGIVQVGVQSSADRYTYVPLIGVFVMLAWGATDLLGGLRYGRIALAAAAALAVATCSILTWRQVGLWRDSRTLFEHTLAVTSGNFAMHNNLGGVLMRDGQVDSAIAHFEESRRIRPDHAPTLSNLGVALQTKGHFGEAIGLFRQAVRLKPSHIEAWLNLGNALQKTGDLDGAVAAFRRAQSLNPDEPAIGAMVRAAMELRLQPADPSKTKAPSAEARARFDRGNALRGEGRLRDAEEEYRAAVRLDPGFAAAHNNLAIALAMRGDSEEAARQFAEVLRLEPRDASVHYNLGVLLAKQGRYAEAIGHFEETLRIDPGYPNANPALEDARRRAAAVKGP